MTANASSSPAIRRFCATESVAIGDLLVGTAAHAERNLLLSWPRAKWGRSLRQASDMPESVSTTLADIAAGGRRVNLIHRREQPSHRHRLFLMPECRVYDVAREQLTGFLRALHDGTSLVRWQAGTVGGSLMLCCTHGKKDRCCAKFGYRAYKAIADTARCRDLPIDVWESTHLGGCRLAASAVVFPALRKYGRITDADVVPLLESEAADRPYLPCYRGDSRLTPVQQCAQVAALEWLAARDIPADVVVEPAPADDEALARELTVRWSGRHGGGSLRVICRARDLLRHDTCADVDGAGARLSRVWHATVVSSLPPMTEGPQPRRRGALQANAEARDD